MCQAEMEWGREREEKGRLEGRLEGHVEGHAEGVDQMARLVKLLMGEKRYEDVKRITVDIPYREKLISELCLGE